MRQKPEEEFFTATIFRTKNFTKTSAKKEVAQKMNEIHLFVEGVASVCDDAKIIAEKALAFFGEKDKRNVDFVLSLKTVRDLFLI